MVLVDTHALLWWQTEDRRLSAPAKRAINTATRVLVSPISCWEIALLVRYGRIRLEPKLFQWISAVFEDEHVELAHLTPSTTAAAGMLSFGGDVADRLLYATAREWSVPIVTKDRAIRAFAAASGDVRTIW